MNTYEEFRALVKLFGDPKALAAEIKRIEDARAAQLKDLEDARAAQEEASKFRAEGAAWRLEAKKLFDEGQAERAKAQTMLDRASIEKAEMESLVAQNEVLIKQLRVKEDAMNVEKRALAERLALADKRDAEVAALKADLDRRLSAIKSAAA